MLRFLGCSLLVISCLAPLPAQAFSNPANVLTTKSGGKIVTSRTSCHPENWANERQNACLCCIVKHAADKAPLSWCQQNKGYCTLRMINGLKWHYKVESDADLVKHILQGKTTGLKEFNMQQHAQLFDKSGNLNDQTAVFLLQEVAEKRIIRSGNFSAKKLGGGGAKTLQLFLISVDGMPRYILKGMANPFGEVKNLTDIKASRLKEFILDPSARVAKGEPRIAMDVDNFAYIVNGQKKYVSLINMAKGKAISSLLFDWRDQKITDPRIVSRAMRILGDNIARIHVNFMTGESSENPLGKTYIHGDMHPYNVFYDGRNGRIIFIDNETFAQSLVEPKDPSIDIVKFYGNLVASFFAQHNYMRDQDPKVFHEIVVKSFIEGYIDVFPESARAAVFRRLYQIMAKQGVFAINKKDSKTVFNPVKLAEMQKDYLIPLFESMQTEEMELPLQQQPNRVLGGLRRR